MSKLDTRCVTKKSNYFGVNGFPEPVVAVSVEPEKGTRFAFNWIAKLGEEDPHLR